MQIDYTKYTFSPVPYFNHFNFELAKKIVIIAVAILGAVFAIYTVAKSFYIKKENVLLKKYTKELASEVQKIIATLPNNGKTAESLKALVSFLVYTDHQEEIETYCKCTKKQEFVKPISQSMTEGYRILTTMIKDDQFPIEKKMEALERLEAERNQCLPTRPGTLHDICNSMEEPKELAERLPWLIARYKVEIIRAVINEPHNVHEFFVQYGNELRLPESVIKAAKADFHVRSRPSNWLKNYCNSCTEEGCLSFVENYINSDLSGRAAYRAYILSSLAEKVPEELIDNKNTEAMLVEKHTAALVNEKKLERAALQKKFADLSTPEALAEWNKIEKRIDLKKTPYIDASLYAHYHYRLKFDDPESNTLTLEAIQLFARDQIKTELNDPASKT